MDKQCEGCGIARPGPVQGKFKCVKFEKIFEQGECILTACIYYIEKVFEDGEALTPIEHLLIMEQNLKSRHMKGPI